MPTGSSPSWIDRLADLLVTRANDPDPALPALLERARSVYRDRLSP
ncbi:hypothetical protein [Actinocorallia sp. A-T 12471]|nr:hypothetical protein [Actinocorallia sp. A-T 12471]MDX6744407.1 hypothetical protein [Actinocorallia sp. A-T 12471]